MRTSIRNSRAKFALVTVALFALTLAPVAQERDRAKVPDRYKWNLADVYPNEAAWRAAGLYSRSK